jgi:hypothetical protein
MNNNQSKLKSISFAIAILVASAVCSRAQSAIATISGTPIGGGIFDYTVTLQNTGSFNLNSFWYGWIQFEDDLPSAPSNAGNSLGWDNDLSGDSIMWINNAGSSAALLPTDSATFTFQSASTPAQMTSGIAGESVAYVGVIDDSQSQAGDSTGIITPTLVAAPEPSSLSLLAVGSLGLLAAGWRKIRAQLAIDQLK